MDVFFFLLTPFGDRHRRSFASISPCSDHPPLSHQPSEDPPSFHPGISFVVFLFPFSFAAPYPTYFVCLCTSPNHLSVSSLTLPSNHLALALPLIYIFSNHVHFHHSQRKSQRFIFVTFISSTCLFVTVFKPNSIADLSTGFFLSKLLFQSCSYPLSQITPDSH